MRIKASIVYRRLRTREGRGFSLKEIQEAGLNVGRARLLGIPVDTRRDTMHGENVEKIKEWLSSTETKRPKPIRPRIRDKRINGRVFRGLTGSGKKMRGLKS